MREHETRLYILKYIESEVTILPTVNLHIHIKIGCDNEIYLKPVLVLVD